LNHTLNIYIMENRYKINKKIILIRITTIIFFFIK